MQRLMSYGRTNNTEYLCGCFITTALLYNVQILERIFILGLFSKYDDGFAELLNYSHMVAPEVMGLKDGGFLAGFWLTGPDIESSTGQELEHLSEMVGRAINQIDVRWCIHFEYFRREAHNYPDGNFKETTTKLIDMERHAQFQ